METQGIPTRSNPEPDQSDEPAVAAAVHLDQFRDARLSQLVNYLKCSLEKDDPLEANMGSVNSGLMNAVFWLDQAMEAAMKSGPPDFERLSRLMPLFDVYLRMTRQVERYAQFELRAVESRQPKPANGNRTMPDKDDLLAEYLSGQSKKNGQSEEIKV